MASKTIETVYTLDQAKKIIKKESGARKAKIVLAGILFVLLTLCFIQDAEKTTWFVVAVILPILGLLALAK